MTKRVGFTVSKEGAPRGSKSVFNSVSLNGRKVKIMSADSYARAVKRADDSLAASERAHRFDQKG